MAQKRALITGISGQDGSYLSELLVKQDYEVFGLLHPNDFGALQPGPGVHHVSGDLRDAEALRDAFEVAKPDEVYNLAAATFVADSFTDPVATCDINSFGPLRMLEIIRHSHPKSRFLQASSSEIFGASDQTPQNEKTALAPRSPYGISKAFAHHTVQSYRSNYGVFASNAILYNHESPHRGLHFLTRKICDAAARISLGLASELRLGNLDIQRDWGYAPDYVHAMHLMLQQEVADDFIIATGELHTPREVLDIAFWAVELDWQKYVVSDPSLFRPTEPNQMLGDATKAREVLGWKPTVTFEEMITEMVKADVARHSGSTVTAEG